MTVVEVERPAVAHLSHSQVSSFTRCGEAYRLTRIAHVREAPSYWSIGGSAIHTAIEAYERGRFMDEPPTSDELVAIFRKDLAERFDYESSHFVDDHGNPDVTAWRAGGRRSKLWPDKEDLHWWRENGATQVKAFFAWRNLQPYEIMAMPDDSPAIECLFTITFPATEIYRAVEIKGAIDAVIVYNTGVVGVRDYKSGSRVPESSSQLGLYSLALEQTIGLRPSFGDYLMTRKMETTEPDTLSDWTMDKLHASYDGVLRAKEAGAYVPNAGQACITCGVKQFCRLKGQPEKIARFETVGLTV